MNPRALRNGLLFAAPLWAGILWFATTDTAARMWLAFTYSWPIWAFIALMSAVSGLLIYGEHRADRIEAARQRERAASLAYWAEVDADLEREAKQRWAALAPRRRGQDLPAVESIGTRSLDELRRDFGGGSDAA